MTITILFFLINIYGVFGGCYSHFLSLSLQSLTSLMVLKNTSYFYSFLFASFLPSRAVRRVVSNYILKQQAI